MKRFIKGFIKLAAVITAIAAIAACIAFICERIEEIKNKGKELAHKPYGIYERYIKRPLDCFLSTGALIVFSPILLVLTIVGAIEMKGNPFFVYPRVGKNSSVFKLVKFRTMAELKDEKGEYLPDEVRLTRYGRFLRSTSLDELLELVNICVGHMSIIGPRPLTYKYLEYYTEEEKHRHDIRPGLTGLAQVNGRNAISWEKRFQYDIEYSKTITFSNDVRIIFQTLLKVIKRSDIGEGNASIKSLHEIRAKNADNDSEYV